MKLVYTYIRPANTGLLPFVIAALLVAGYADAQSISAPLFERAGAIDADIADVTMDEQGNVYFVGTKDLDWHSEPLGSVDFDPGPNIWPLLANDDGHMVFVGKMAPDFDLQWLKIVRAIKAPVVRSMSVDAGGNVLVLGSFPSQNEEVDFGEPGEPYVVEQILGKLNFAWKINPDGTTNWAQNIGRMDTLVQIAAGPGGSIHITGSFTTTVDFDPGPGAFMLTPTNLTGIGTGADNMFILKLDSDGNFVWARHFAESASAQQTIQIAVADTGSVYAAVRFVGQVDADPGPGIHRLFGSSSHVLVALDIGGNFVWAQDSSDDTIKSVSLDDDGGLLLQFSPDQVSRYSLTGNLLWSRSFASAGYCTISSVAPGGENDFYVLGSYYDFVDIGTGPADMARLEPAGYLIARWDLNNTQLWCTQLHYGEQSWNISATNEIFFSPPGRLTLTLPAAFVVDANPATSQAHTLTPFNDYDQYFVALRSHDGVWLDFDANLDRQMDATLDFPLRSLNRAVRAIQPGQTITIVSPGAGINTSETGIFSKPATLVVVGAPARIGVQTP